MPPADKNQDSREASPDPRAPERVVPQTRPQYEKINYEVMEFVDFSAYHEIDHTAERRRDRSAWCCESGSSKDDACVIS